MNRRSVPTLRGNWLPLVLIVEDDRVTARLIKAELARLAVRAQHCSTLSEAEEALASEPALLLLDLNLPDGEGLAWYKNAREMNRTSAPAIVLTANERADLAARCFAAGAVDVLRKPIRTGELSARVRYNLELGDAVAQLANQNDALQHELGTAAQLQRSLLPSLEHDDVELVTRAMPSSLLGGDMCGAQRLDDETIAIYLLDVCGHGTAAALVAVACCLTINDLLARAAIRPAELDSQLSHVLDIDQTGYYATLSLAILNTKRRLLRIFNYGHTPAILADADGVRYFGATAPPLGLGLALPQDEQVVEMQAGQRLLLFSDGISDPSDSSFHQEVARLGEVLCDRSQSLAGTADTILVQRSTADDDRTLVALEFSAPDREQVVIEERRREVSNASYSLPSRLDQLAGAWACVEPVLQAHRWRERDLDELRIALTEALANAIEHAHGEDGRPVRFSLQASNERVVFRIIDTGLSKRPVPPDCPDPDSERGRGLFLIYTIADKVEWYAAATGHELRFTKERGDACATSYPG